MILFREDWNKQKAYVHTRTSNKSFIRMSMVLKKMGIKNNKFFLALYNKDLEKLDPYDTNLTHEQKLAIAAECQINPWYVIREVIRISLHGGSGSIHFILNRANLAFIWCFLNSVDCYVTIPRQTGKTIGIHSLIVDVMYFMYYHAEVGVFNKDKRLLHDNVKRFKELRDMIPDYLYSETILDVNNKEGVTYAKRKNTYTAFVATGDPTRASGTARGSSVAFPFWDEFAWYINNHIAYPDASSAYVAAMMDVRKLGYPAATILATTAGKIDSKTGSYAYGIKNKCARFHENVYDKKNVQDLKEYLSVNASSIYQMFYIEYSYKQLGLGKDWLIESMKNKTLDRIMTDVFNIWIYGANRAALTIKQLQKLKGNIKEPSFQTYYKNLTVNWYVNKTTYSREDFKRKPLIIGSDTSDNSGRDFTTIVLTNPDNLQPVATCRCNKSNFTHMVQLVAKLLLEFPNSILIPERNKNGAVMIDFIIELLAYGGKDFNPFKRIYNSLIDNLTDQDWYDKTRNASFNDVNIRKYFGFTTTGGSREFLYSTIFREAIQITDLELKDAILSDEIASLYEKNGRIDHPDDGHDDLTVAWLITCHFILRCKNLNFYNVSHCALQDTKEKKEEQVKNVIRFKIADLMNKVDTTKSDTLRIHYERQLELLRAKYPQCDDIVNAKSFVEIQQDTNQTKSKDKGLNILRRMI